MKTKILIAAISFLVFFLSGPGPTSTSPGKVFGQEALSYVVIFADHNAGSAPLTVNFGANLTNPYGDQFPVTYEWDFGDGAASTKKSSQHTFTAAGTYSVTLQVTIWKSPKKVVEDTFTVTVIENLDLTIAADVSSGDVPHAVAFTSTVTGAVGNVAYQWEFGDETVSAEAEPGHTFNSPGTYSVTCTVTDSAIPPRTIQATTQIDVYAILELSIATDTLSGNAPLTVNFTSTVTGAVGTMNYVWEFGGEATAAGAERSYTFNSPGTYPVTCTVSDSTDASRSAQASIDIEVTAGDLAVCIEDNSQINVQIAPDGAGGALIVWQDLRKGSDYDIYAQKLGSDRSPKWTANGVALCRLDGHQHSPQVAPDGAGGAIIVWQDSRGGDTSDIYAQRVDKDGKVLWTTDGVAVCNAADNQSVPQIASDGAGGAIIVWQDNRNSVESKYDIYAQRLDMDGNPKWFPNGIPVCRAPNYQTLSQIASDGAGGAFIAWMDFRNGSHYDIYAQQVDVDGNLKWSQGDKAVCTAANQQYYPQLIADGAGGAIVTWQDFRSGSHYDIYAMRVATIMDLTWPQNGVAVCTAADEQSYPQLVTDRAGGAIITWRDKRNTDTFDVYAQRLGGNGSVLWAENGLAACTLPYDQSFPDLVSDGAGGAVITWQDSRSGTETHNDVYAQSIDGDANFRWAENGLPVCVKPLHQSNPKITYYGTGGTIIVWIDSRTANWDIYAQRVNQDGNFE